MPGSHSFMDASNFSRMFAKQHVIIAAVNQTHSLIYPHRTPAYCPSLSCSGLPFDSRLLSIHVKSVTLHPAPPRTPILLEINYMSEQHFYTH